MWNKRRSIWEEMEAMQKQMDEIFNNFGRYQKRGQNLLENKNNKNAITPSYREPLADVFETEKDITATVELPGVKKEDINIEIIDNGIQIKVEKRNEHKEEDKEKGFYRIERSYNGFYRFIPVGKNIDSEKIDATYNNGVLEVRIPKLKQIDNKKKIEVK
jgi:HSP20 family protein